MDVLIIGAGGAGSVVAKKCAMNADIFGRIHLASRTLSKCLQIQQNCTSPITVSQLDADRVTDTIALIEEIQPQLVINMALPYQDLAIMDACLATGVNYLDTANYEPRNLAKFEYSWQWAYQERFREKGIQAILGCGFDPGVTNIFCAYAQKHLFDEIHTIDITDCNAGDHGQAFATNFNPEINIREITQRGRYWEKGEWKEINPLSVSTMIDYPEVGPRKSYLLYHEELESLVKHIKGLQRIRFWMTFGDEYIKHLQVLQNVGMTSIEPVEHQGVNIIPLEFLKTLLPEPSSLAHTYTGKTSIGCIFSGIQNGQSKRIIIYNVCDHADCYQELGAQAVSYTTGVPAVTGAILMGQNHWKGQGVFNVEELDPDPFLVELSKQGLSWQIKDLELEEGTFDAVA